MEKVTVNLGKRSYPIVIGYNLKGELRSFLAAQKYSRRAMVVSDDNVAPLYGDGVLAALKDCGLEAELVIVPAGEGSKSLAMADKIYTSAIENRLDRLSPIFALGGGVVGDLAGFVAATYMRGVPFIQLPTSLLAAVDSSVGGKVAVNHPLGKNLIGAFYQPQGVFIDLSRFATLPKREIATGLGEIIKYGVISDPELFTFLAANAQRVTSLEEGAITRIVTRSCEIKANVVGEDEKESGLRRILNFGHTIAHAIEKETGYSRYNHGEAVAIGMAAAAGLSCDMGLCSDADYSRVTDLIKAYGLPLKAAGLDKAAVYEDLFHDKKVIDGRINWVLMKGIGKVITSKDVSEALVKKAIAQVVR